MKIQVSQTTKETVEAIVGTKLFKFSPKGTFEIKVSIYRSHFALVFDNIYRMALSCKHFGLTRKMAMLVRQHHCRLAKVIWKMKRMRR